MPLPSAETTPPVTKTYFVWCSLTRRLPRASRSRSTGVDSIAGAERAALTDEGQRGERTDRAPPPPSRELLHGTET